MTNSGRHDPSEARAEARARPLARPRTSAIPAQVRGPTVKEGANSPPPHHIVIVGFRCSMMSVIRVRTDSSTFACAGKM